MPTQSKSEEAEAEKGEVGRMMVTMLLPDVPAVIME